MDFKKSMSDGMLAAKRARKSKAEINAVIESLNKEVRTVSGGVVELKITDEKKLSPRHNTLSASISSLAGVDPYIDYQAISINKIGNPSEKKILAEWKIDPSDGYPCVISYKNKNIACRNMATLIEALNSLMSDAQTGEKLLEFFPSSDHD
ncbi:Uncharacterised protein [Klebsiella pneumoniae]|uniref:Uncharacterized protein n=1 Tax=Klebsiella pneumoniae TaxID=573 RepID=A0A2X3F8I1_KLEPN|nr:hypothetical protein [Klebsiella pneumoniae]SBG54016.1 Uncharacterised protein [Klebsiella pneumoniae]SBJ78004.1 Uncharacterised protein [Klebsiella pneumoniae]SQC45223.1 Uncharacterised protein [Klebsiella pneumoniae]SYU54414.1 Uncharacterised protein [Klebsiella pneumoniae]HBY9515450.1 hypothetical protein [Klebsiella pneumoniae]